MFGRERLNGYWKGIEKRRYDTRDYRNSQPFPHAAGLTASRPQDSRVSRIDIRHETGRD